MRRAKDAFSKAATAAMHGDQDAQQQAHAALQQVSGELFGVTGQLT